MFGPFQFLFHKQNKNYKKRIFFSLLSIPRLMLCRVVQTHHTNAKYYPPKFCSTLLHNATYLSKSASKQAKPCIKMFLYKPAQRKGMNQLTIMFEIDSNSPHSSRWFRL